MTSFFKQNQLVTVIMVLILALPVSTGQLLLMRRDLGGGTLGHWWIQYVVIYNYKTCVGFELDYDTDAIRPYLFTLSILKGMKNSYWFLIVLSVLRFMVS